MGILGAVNGINVLCSCVHFSYDLSFQALLLVHKSSRVCLCEGYRVVLLSPNSNRDGERLVGDGSQFIIPMRTQVVLAAPPLLISRTDQGRA